MVKILLSSLHSPLDKKKKKRKEKRSWLKMAYKKIEVAKENSTAYVLSYVLLINK